MNWSNNSVIIAATHWWRRVRRTMESTLPAPFWKSFTK